MGATMQDLRLLVVGASSGVGAEVARLAGSEGARLALAARRGDRLAEVAADIGAALPVAGDVCVEEDALRMVDEAVAAFGGLDAVVYAVGVSPLLSMADATQADWRAVFDSNVIGAAMVSSAAAPHLLDSGGRLVLLSSKSVRRPWPDLSLYTTSKIALDGLIRCLPVEFPGLRVTRVVVGNTGGTDFTAHWDAEALAAAIDRWTDAGVLGPTGTMTPLDVAETIAHVLGASAHIDDIAVLDVG